MRMAKAGCTRILAAPLYPQYCAATTATANDAVFAALASMSQPVRADRVRVRLPHRFWEGIEQLGFKQRIVRKLQVFRSVLKNDLRARQDDRELGAGQPAIFL